MCITNCTAWTPPPLLPSMVLLAWQALPPAAAPPKKAALGSQIKSGRLRTSTLGRRRVPAVWQLDCKCGAALVAGKAQVDHQGPHVADARDGATQCRQLACVCVILAGDRGQQQR